MEASMNPGRVDTAPGQLDLLEGTIGELDGSLERLEHKLSSLRTPSPEREMAVPQAAPVNRLDNITMSIRALSTRVNMLNRELEL